MGRKFSIKHKKEDGSEEELSEPLIIKYVAPKHNIVQIELNKSIEEKNLAIESKEAQLREFIDKYIFFQKVSIQETK
ncbi:MAG: hypothetical protein U1C19_04130 [Methanobacteriaceae archaeon]|nr:hypothetical protein [Methanobacteriaceae archaeon]